MAIGDITTTAIATLDYAANVTSEHTMVHHSGTTYVLGHSDASRHGYIRTFDISDDGTTITAIDSWKFYTGTTVGVAIVKVAANLFFVFTKTSVGCEGFTVQIDNSGIITKAKYTTTGLLYNGVPYCPRVIRIKDTDYYVTSNRQQTTNLLLIRVFHIDPNTGVITQTDYDDTQPFGYNSAIVELPNRVLVSVANNTTNQGFIRTWTINVTTGLLSAVLDSEAFTVGTYPYSWVSVLPVYESGNLVVFHYYGSGDDGYLQTARVDLATGAITLINNLEFDTALATRGRLHRLDYKGNFMIAYNGYSVTNPTTEGYIKTFTIDVQGVIALHESWAMGAYAWDPYGECSGTILPIGDLDAGIFALTRSRTSGHYGSITTIHVEADLNLAGSKSVRLFAPVDALPILTSGRNTTGYAVGREPKYTLDNDPDTWWTPSSTADSALYYDLGSAKTVDAITFWLHNYNEEYQDTKSWTVSYSSDDATYYALETKLFTTYRTNYGPMIVDEFVIPVSARYWKIEFTNFDAAPVTISPEISCVWFMNDYSLPWHHQRPEINKLLYFNNQSITRSGHSFATHAGLGKQRVIQRDFVFVENANQWTNLYDAYAAARGSNQPIIIQSELDSNQYYAMQFAIPLSPNMIDSSTRMPRVVLRELGYKRVSYTDHILGVLDLTVGLWHFRDDALDDSGNDNDLTVSGTPTWYHGATEHDNTSVQIVNPDKYTLAAADATDFDMGTGSFTVEVWVRVDVATTSMLVHKYVSVAGGLIMGFDLGFNASGANQRWQVKLGDGVTTIATITPNIDLGEYHLFTAVVNRTADTVTIYRDGVLFDGPDDISTITGSMSCNTRDLNIGSTVAGVYIDEVCITKRILTATEIATRYAGRIAYGEWGM
ncbi:MAG: LamG-like jellyroll fold domain-containing protein [Patescibacteria group bacterium]|jgi:hypothetical protein